MCQLKQKQQFGIQCKKQQNANQVRLGWKLYILSINVNMSTIHSETTNTTGLKINLDGKSLATFVSDDEDGVFSLITLPLKRELQRSARQGLGRGRRKGKNNCIHKLSCSEGSKELESLRIISNCKSVNLIYTVRSSIVCRAKEPNLIFVCWRCLDYHVTHYLQYVKYFAF